MANTYNSIKRYVWSATFDSNDEFLAPTALAGRESSDIKVKVGKTELTNSQFSLTNNKVKFNAGFTPNVGDSIRIYRQTGHDGRLVDFVDGSLLTSETLDLDSDQLFNIAIEAYDKGDEATIGSESFYYSQGTNPNDDITGNVDTGTLWYDTSNTPFTLKVWNGSEWQAAAPARVTKKYGTTTAGGKTAVVSHPTNGSFSQFTDAAFTSGSDLYLNGVKLVETSSIYTIPSEGDYTVDNGTVTFLDLSSASDILVSETFNSHFSSSVFDAETSAETAAQASETYAGLAADRYSETVSAKSDASDYASDATKYAINPKDQTFTTSNGIGGQYSAKHYAETAADSATTANTAATSANVTTVATDLALGSNSKIKKVSDDIADVTAVAGKLTEVDALAGKTSEMTTLTTGSALSDINTVAGKATEVGQVAAIDSEIADVAQKLSEIDAVEAKLDDIEDVAEVATKVSDVAGIIPDITTVASDPYKSKIETVYTHRDTITDVGGDITKVTTVADDLNGANTIGTLADPTYKLKVTDVANQINAVETVSASINNNDIGTVVSNMDNIGTVVSNIADVQNAWDNANTASVSATTASNKADEASIEASNALSYSNTAAGHANTSLTNKNAAQSAQAAAELARSVAQTAKDEAESASALALSSKNQAVASEGNAAASASSAATSASNAATSESNAAASESQAEVYMNTSNAWGSFYQKRYLGDKTSNPSVDNAGNALQNGALYFNTSDNTMYVYNGSTWVAAQSTINNVNWGGQLSGHLNTNSHDIRFGDDDKALFGAGNDLKIYHSANNESYIHEVGSGNLNILATNLKLQDADENLKVLVNSTGIDVTGTVTADGLTVDNSIAPIVTLTETGVGTYYTVVDGGHYSIRHNDLTKNYFRLQSNGDISFYEDTGTTPKFFWDASAERLGIGTSSPRNQLTVGNTTDSADDQNATVGIKCDANHQGIMLQENSGAEQWSMGVNADGDLNFYDSQVTTPTVTFKDNGGVGIGTTSPTTRLDVVGSYGTTPVKLLRHGDNGSVVTLGRNGVDAGVTLDYPASNTLGISTNSNERMRIDSSGNVGIGTASPATALDISQSNARGAYLRSSTTGSRMHFLDATTSSITTVGIGAEGNNLVLHGGGAEFMRVASSGKVGIGTSSPAEKLEVQGRVTVNNSYGYRIGATSSGDAHVGDLTNTSGVLTLRTEGNRSIRFDTAGSERVRLDHTGNLLVGKTSSGFNTAGVEFASSGRSRFTRDNANVIEVNRTTNNGSLVTFNKDGAPVGSIGTDSNSQLMIGSGDTGLSFQSNNDAIIPRNTSGAARTGLINLGTSGAQFKDLYLSGNVFTDEGFYGNRVWNEDNSSLRFATNNTEKMRIDESGNLLVGKTSASSSTVGAQLNANGTLTATVDGNRTAILNRLTSDGNIIDFRKGGSTIGAISVINGNNLRIGGTADNHAGLQFGTNIIYPEKGAGGNISDGTIDIGNAGGRFKDLYLSGGVHLGGTTAANKLDDYEEGTFTLTTNSDSSGVFQDTPTCLYTKIGNIVNVFITFRVGTNFTSQFVGGLPFATSHTGMNSSYLSGGIAITSNNNTVSATVGNNGTTIRFHDNQNTSDAHLPNTTDEYYRLNFTYKTA